MSVFAERSMCPRAVLTGATEVVEEMSSWRLPTRSTPSSTFVTVVSFVPLRGPMDRVKTAMAEVATI